MSDAWDEIQAIKSKRNSLRERLEKRKKERQDILGSSTSAALPDIPPATTASATSATATVTAVAIVAPFKPGTPEAKEDVPLIEDESDTEIEYLLLQILCDTTILLPITVVQLLERINLMRFKAMTPKVLNNFLQKLATQSYITLNDGKASPPKGGWEVLKIDHLRIQTLYKETDGTTGKPSPGGDLLKRKCEIDALDDSSNGSKMSKLLASNGKKVCGAKNLETTDLMSLLSMPSTREKQSKQVGEEILDLLSKPTAKERSLVEKFKSQGGAQVMEFCPHGTRAECERHSPDELDDEEPQQSANGDQIRDRCNKLHFKKIIQLHTDESLGDCSFLNTCFHMDSCKYVHYEVDSEPSASKNIIAVVESDKKSRAVTRALGKIKNIDPTTALHPAQWIQCDLRFLDMTILGKFAVIMADPPWDIHMESENCFIYAIYMPCVHLQLVLPSIYAYFCLQKYFYGERSHTDGN